MTDRPVQLVLDTPAVLDYCRGSLPVGELLVEIDAGGGAVALPLLCLVEAANINPDDEHWLDMLVQHPATEVIGVKAELWKTLAAVRDTVGRVDAASAALMALDYDVDVATRTPGVYAGLGGGEIALPLED